MTNRTWQLLEHNNSKSNESKYFIWNSNLIGKWIEIREYMRHSKEWSLEDDCHNRFSPDFLPSARTKSCCWLEMARSNKKLVRTDIINHMNHAKNRTKIKIGQEIQRKYFVERINIYVCQHVPRNNGNEWHVQRIILNRSCESLINMSKQLRKWTCFAIY